MSRQLLLEGTDSGFVCPTCGRAMVVRTMHSNQHQFLGCSGYPHCEETMEIPASMLIAEELDYRCYEVNERDVILVAKNEAGTKFRIRLSKRNYVKILEDMI